VIICLTKHTTSPPSGGRRQLPLLTVSPPGRSAQTCNMRDVRIWPSNRGPSSWCDGHHAVSSQAWKQPRRLIMTNKWLAEWSARRPPSKPTSHKGKWLRQSWMASIRDTSTSVPTPIHLRTDGKFSVCLMAWQASSGSRRRVSVASRRAMMPHS